MATSAQSPGKLSFDGFEVDLCSGEVWKHGLRVRLQDQPFQVLRVLLERCGEIVTRDELKQMLWPADTFVDFDDGLNTALGRIADAYEQLGNSDEALTYVKKFQQAVSNRSVSLLPLARIYASMGKRREAVQVLRTIEKNSELDGKEHMLALIYSALGERDRAIAELEKGVQTRSLMPFVFADPQLDSLRSDPRFQQLLRRAKLPS